MTERIHVGKRVPEIYQAMAKLQAEVEKAATNAGVDQKILELVKMRSSQINHCAFCLDMHSHDAVQMGESPRRLFVLQGWRETELFTEQERAALALTEAITNVATLHEVPDDVYDEATRVFSEEQYRAIVWEAIAINSWNRMCVTSHAPLPERAE
ncbi:alkylhydroperoxidase [Amycolatopsis coloradensis]|uniref:Alkylhydroperoxidase n=1 Tax=Amycolatopsis coloradensis TaxID=76021 RepID=A0A1R0KRW1_9PSEU|nr:carboxymuconolactone decarboxylase family protein [Amycolatopsis coloradensis]OLZ50580.1 alkylhydroperoxidase [Amycolatopsis coloradensis]